MAPLRMEGTLLLLTSYVCIFSRRSPRVIAKNWTNSKLLLRVFCSSSSCTYHRENSSAKDLMHKRQAIGKILCGRRKSKSTLLSWNILGSLRVLTVSSSTRSCSSNSRGSWINFFSHNNDNEELTAAVGLLVTRGTFVIAGDIIRTPFLNWSGSSGRGSDDVEGLNSG